MDPASTDLTSFTDSVILRASAGGRPRSIAVQVIDEARGIAQFPVLSTTALARGVLIASGPGSATLKVSADSTLPVTVRVRVNPAVPAILGVRSTTHGHGPDTATLLGYRIQEISSDAFRLDGEPLEVVSRDGAGIKVIARPVVQSACGGATVPGRLTATNAQVALGVSVPRPREGELRMRPGEWRYLTTAEAACVRLPPAGGAYVLAYADLRQIELGKMQWAGLLQGDYAVTVRDRTAAATAALHGSSSAFAGGLARPGLTSAIQRNGTPGYGDAGAALHDDGGPVASTWSICDQQPWTSREMCRTTPWTLGEEFRVLRPFGTDSVAARVYRIYQNKFVFVEIVGEESDVVRQFKERLDTAMAYMMASGFSVLRNALGPDPVTSAGSGQLYVIVGDFAETRVNRVCCVPQIGVATSVMLSSRTISSQVGVVWLLAHELTHSWQFRWFHDNRPAGASISTYPPFWAMEGGAELLAFEVSRRYEGFPWVGNLRASNLRGSMLSWEAAAAGTISAGYHHASSYLRDLVWRMTVAGLPLDAALREVASGALEDWYGYDEDGIWRGGLAHRLRPKLGAQWDPGAALLLYALAQGADDLTSSAELQNPFYLGVSSDADAGGFYAPMLVAGSSGSLRIPRPATSAGILRLRDGGKGSSFQASSDQPNAAWAIARVQ